MGYNLYGGIRRQCQRDDESQVTFYKTACILFNLAVSCGFSSVELSSNSTCITSGASSLRHENGPKVHCGKNGES
jgi:hypothetical protein